MIDGAEDGREHADIGLGAGDDEAVDPTLPQERGELGRVER